jgi:hypothetical protein
VIVDSSPLRIEFHPEGDGVTTKTPDDFVTVLLAGWDAGTLHTAHGVHPESDLSESEWLLHVALPRMRGKPSIRSNNS